MPDKTPVEPHDAETGSASIEQLLAAEKAVEAQLAEASKAAVRLVEEAYEKAQSFDREIDGRIEKLSRDCGRETDRRVAEIQVEAIGIQQEPVDTKAVRGAIRTAADRLAARLTGAES